MISWRVVIGLSAVLAVSVALAEDIKTVTGKIYKDATVNRVDADGIEFRTKTGISKVYFAELPPDIQERFNWAKPTVPPEPFYGRWVGTVRAGAQDPAALAKIIAAGAAILASVALVMRYIRSRLKPTRIALDRRSRRPRGKTLK